MIQVPTQHFQYLQCIKMLHTDLHVHVYWEFPLCAYIQSLESERKACVSRLEELQSALRRECGETRAELAREIATSLQVSCGGRV